MSNTGQKIWLTLKKVTNDVDEFPLDVNNNLCSASGLPQDTKVNMEGLPDYLPNETDITSCPITTLSPEEPQVELNYCFSAITLEGSVLMKTIVSDLDKPSGYSHALRALGGTTPAYRVVDPNVKLIVDLPSGVNKILIGQVLNPNFYPNVPVRTYPSSPSSQAGCLVDIDGKIYAETTSSFSGFAENLIELPSSISSEPYITSAAFICNDCQIEYNSDGEEILNSCGIYPYE